MQDVREGHPLRQHFDWKWQGGLTEVVWEEFWWYHAPLQISDSPLGPKWAALGFRYMLEVLHIGLFTLILERGVSVSPACSARANDAVKHQSSCMSGSMLVTL